MDKTMLGQRLLGAIVVGFACLDAVAANDSPPAALALEHQARTEYAQAGDAVRERLAREAAGDPIGARIAARNAAAHRSRFLDIQRELARLHSPSAATPSVAASRSPFLPDPAFLAPSADGAASTPERKQPVVAVRISHPAWDLYRPHESPDSTGVRDGAQLSQKSQAPGAGGRVGDMYSKDPPRRVPNREVAADDPSRSVSSGELPREPFLVYLVRSAGREARE
jgi:hypothetical protein